MVSAIICCSAGSDNCLTYDVDPRNDATPVKGPLLPEMCTVNMCNPFVLLYEYMQ